MTAKKAADDANPKLDEHLAEHSNLVKDPDDWVSGDDAMTGAQASYLKTLCEQAGEPYKGNLTKAEASKRIDELRSETGQQ